MSETIIRTIDQKPSGEPHKVDGVNPLGGSLC